MNSKKEVQHVYLVGAKSLGAYGGYETFVYKLTEYVINNNPNGLNINNNAGSTHIEGLQKFVVEKGLDVGFAYDGEDYDF